MNKRFVTPDLSDERVIYAAEYLEGEGFIRVKKSENADFSLLGVNPDKALINSNIPVFAGNVSADNVYDYTKSETFAISNAYLTAEGALALAIKESKLSLINSEIMIIGFGRIGKALQNYLKAFTSDIKVCVRRPEAAANVRALCCESLSFEDLKNKNGCDFIFNTVPHPVMNENELSSVKKDALIIDLASFPGGVDRHIAESKGIRVIFARGLPSLYSPKTAGLVVGKTVCEMIREVII